MIGILMSAFITPMSAPAGEPMDLSKLDLEKDRPVLSLPLVQKKLVLAHYMTEFLIHQGNDRDLFMRTDLYDPDGVSAKFGGIHQYRPMSAILPGFKDLPIKDAAAFEMRAALKLGVDGFQFYYPDVLDDAFHRRYVETIKAFFDAADEQQIPFKLTLCLSLPVTGNEQQKREQWVKFIGPLLTATQGSDKWVRTPDGRYVIYLYAPDSLADNVGNAKHFTEDPAKLKDVALAYERLARALGIGIAYIYPLHFPDNDALVNAALDYFPAVWDWVDVDPDSSEASWQRVAALCRERKRAYTQSVHSDYYGSKVFDESKTPRQMAYFWRDLAGMDPAKLMRDCEPTQLSYAFRRQLQRAVATDAALINYTTWNDYPEGHHIAPEINHNFGFPLLLQHYKRQWLGQAPEPGDKVVIFYKKYPHTAVPSHFPIPYRLKMHQELEARDDYFEVVSLLDAPAELWFKGRRIGELRPGLVSTLIPLEPGMVHLEVKRGGKRLLALDPPEGVTEHPYRTDRLTYAWSSECRRIFKELYGDVEMPVSDEYAVDKKGVPNWKARYKFWEP